MGIDSILPDEFPLTLYLSVRIWRLGLWWFVYIPMNEQGASDYLMAFVG